MPRVNLTDQRPRRFSAWLRSYITTAGGVDRLAGRMGCSRATVYNRIKEPGSLSLDNLRAIRQNTGMTVDELTEQIRNFL